MLTDLLQIIIDITAQELDAGQHVLVLGIPGAGKTTFIRSLAAMAVESQRPNPCYLSGFFQEYPLSTQPLWLKNDTITQFFHQPQSRSLPRPWLLIDEAYNTPNIAQLVTQAAFVGAGVLLGAQYAGVFRGQYEIDLTDPQFERDFSTILQGQNIGLCQSQAFYASSRLAILTKQQTVSLWFRPSSQTGWEPIQSMHGLLRLRRGCTLNTPSP